MRVVVTLSVLALLGCGQAFSVDPRTISGVDEEFVPYVDAYLRFKGRRMSYDIPIRFADLENDKAGKCTIWSSGHRQIQIDSYLWHNVLDEGAKYQLVFHELGHCDLNRGHVNSTTNNIPDSIMYPYVFSLNDSNIDFYVRELFSTIYSSSARYRAVNGDNCIEYIQDGF
jgi:hypothetical protein